MPNPISTFLSGFAQAHYRRQTVEEQRQYEARTRAVQQVVDAAIKSGNVAAIEGLQKDISRIFGKSYYETVLGSARATAQGQQQGWERVTGLLQGQTGSIGGPQPTPTQPSMTQITTPGFFYKGAEGQPIIPSPQLISGRRAPGDPLRIEGMTFDPRTGQFTSINIKPDDNRRYDDAFLALQRFYRMRLARGENDDIAFENAMEDTYREHRLLPKPAQMALIKPDYQIAAQKSFWKAFYLERTLTPQQRAQLAQETGITDPRKLQRLIDWFALHVGAQTTHSPPPSVQPVLIGEAITEIEAERAGRVAEERALGQERAERFAFFAPGGPLDRAQQLAQAKADIKTPLPGNIGQELGSALFAYRQAYMTFADTIGKIVTMPDGKVDLDRLPVGPVLESIRKRLDRWGLNADSLRIDLRAAVRRQMMMMYEIGGRQISDKELAVFEDVIAAMNESSTMFLSKLESFMTYIGAKLLGRVSGLEESYFIRGAVAQDVELMKQLPTLVPGRPAPTLWTRERMEEYLKGAQPRPDIEGKLDQIIERHTKEEESVERPNIPTVEGRSLSEYLREKFPGLSDADRATVERLATENPGKRIRFNNQTGQFEVK